MNIIIKLILLTLLSVTGLLIAYPSTPTLNWNLESENLMNIAKWSLLVILITTGASKLTDDLGEIFD